MPKPSKNTLTYIAIFPCRKRFEEKLRNRKWSKNCFVKGSTSSISQFQTTNKFVRHLLYTHRKERISKAYSQRIVTSWKQQTSQEWTETLIQILNKLGIETKCRWRRLLIFFCPLRIFFPLIWLQLQYLWTWCQERRTERCSPRLWHSDRFCECVWDTCPQAVRERNVGP